MNSKNRSIILEEYKPEQGCVAWFLFKNLEPAETRTQLFGLDILMKTLKAMGETGLWKLNGMCQLL